MPAKLTAKPAPVQDLKSHFCSPSIPLAADHHLPMVPYYQDFVPHSDGICYFSPVDHSSLSGDNIKLRCPH